MTGEIRKRAKDSLKEVIRIRRTLHRHPEPAFEEYQTAALVRQMLDRLGISWKSCGTGTVAELPGRKGAPVVVLRADMDALPVTEKTGLTFSSEAPGFMHACGHDGHTAMLLGAAMIMKSLPNLENNVKLVFQPAEENCKGANLLIGSGLLDDADVFYASHLWPTVPYGKVYIADGPVLAGGDIFNIRITGRGGHGAKAYMCIDPIPAITAITDAIHAIKSLDVPGDVPLTVTVGSIQCGSAPNVIPDSGEIGGTSRWFSSDVQQLIRKRIREIACQTAPVYGADAEVEFIPLSDSTYNDPKAAEEARRILRELYPEMVLSEMPLDMASEDFAYYRKVAPSVMALIGCQKEETNCGLHSPGFTFEEEIMGVGMALYAGFAAGFKC